MKPVISIIIPCLNQGLYLIEAVESVNQFPDKEVYEIVIVNDGSSEAGTLQIFKKLEMQGYHIIHQANKGLGAARNVGIKAALGKYILPLDCDNKIRPEYISESLTVLENQDNIDVVYADGEFFGERTGTFKSKDFNLQVLMIENPIDACAVFRKAIWEKVGGYDENMPAMGLEDWDFWLRIAFAGGQFRYLNKVLFDYRYVSDSMMRSMEKAKLELVKAYMQQKYKSYCNTEYLNKLVYNNISNRKILVVHILLKTVFPRLHRFLLRKGIIRDNDLI